MAVAVRTRRLDHGLDLAFLGIFLAGLGIAIPATVGFRLEPVGLLDRANAMAVPGIAIFLAAMTSWLASRASPRLARGAVAVTLCLFAAASLQTGYDVRRVNADVIAAFDAIEPLPDGSIVTLPVRSGYFIVDIHEQRRLDSVAESLGYSSRDIAIGNTLIDRASLDFDVHQTVTVTVDGKVIVSGQN